MSTAHYYQGRSEPIRGSQLFTVTLYDERDGPALNDPSYTTEVWARDREDARKKAQEVLRGVFPGQLNRIRVWCTVPRYFTDA